MFADPRTDDNAGSCAMRGTSAVATVESNDNGEQQDYAGPGFHGRMIPERNLWSAGGLAGPPYVRFPLT